MKKVDEQPAERPGATSGARQDAGARKPYEKPSAKKVGFNAVLATRM